MALAIFDLDETLIHGDCASLWSEQMARLVLDGPTGRVVAQPLAGDDDERHVGHPALVDLRRGHALLDEPEAQDDVRAARLGDEDAFERAAEADLLWYDVTEREALAESLGV